jgi:DNA topoisomerase I
MTPTRRSRPSAERFWRRVGTPAEGFRYLRADGAPLRARAALDRIAALVIPPAWTDVRIAADPAARVQVTGVDRAGRTQYRYHPEFTAKRSRDKYRKLLDYARVLPELRSATARHLRAPPLSRERVLATAVRLMMRGFFRVGSERYAVQNRTFGLVTLRKSHVAVRDDTLVFTYRGKAATQQRQVVAGTPLVSLVEELVRQPGSRLFQYRDAAGQRRPVTAREVNAYLKEILGARYTSKDIRTWGGTVRAAVVLAELGPPADEREAARNLTLTARLVAAELGNTPTVCRAAYIHPAVMEGYARGRTIAPLMRKEARPTETEPAGRYYPEEAALMRFLERHSSPGRAARRAARRTGSTSRRRPPAGSGRARR